MRNSLSFILLSQSQTLVMCSGLPLICHSSFTKHRCTQTPATESVSPWPGPAGACSRRLRTTRSHRSTSATSASPPSLRLPLISLSLVLFELRVADCGPSVWMISLIFREVASAPVSTRHPECVVCVTRARGQTKFTSSQLLARNLERPPGAPDPPPIDTHALQCTQKERNVHLTAQRSLRASSGLLKRQ